MEPSQAASPQATTTLWYVSSSSSRVTRDHIPTGCRLDDDDGGWFNPSLLWLSRGVKKDGPPRISSHPGATGPHLGHKDPRTLWMKRMGYWVG